MPGRLILILILFTSHLARGQFSISANKRFLTKDGKPFFWLGDTAWELFHRLTREEADRYLQKRKEQGFTVIQAVVLAEMDGIRKPNAYGHRPLLNEDPSTPDEKYFEHVDYIIDKADSLGINIALLPCWGDKIDKGRWGKGPEILNKKNAAALGTWLAKRYKNRTNIIWVLGGDRNPRSDADVAIWNAMGNAIQQATTNKAIISFHPTSGAYSSAEWFHKQNWLSFNMFQTGHCRDEKVYDKIGAVYNLLPVKPVMDAESIYEDHPICFNAKDLGLSNAYDIRRLAYLDLFSGAFGHTYGCHDVWQMYSPREESINGATKYWFDALDLPGANQLKYVRRLIETHSMADRVPDQSIIKENNYPPSQRIQATRGRDYIFVYTAEGLPFTLMPRKISGQECTGHWMNPRDGSVKEAGKISLSAQKVMIPPTTGYGQDWVLVIENEHYKNSTAVNSF